MQIEIKIHGELAELQHILAAMAAGPSQTASTAKPKKAKDEAPLPNYPSGTAQEPHGPEFAPSTAIEVIQAASSLFTPKQETTEAPTPTTEAPQETAITKDVFRTKVSEKALINRTAVKAILTKYGAAKANDVADTDYPTVIAELDKITA